MIFVDTFSSPNRTEMVNVYLIKTDTKRIPILRSFTLVKLLDVISIIDFLIALLLSAIASSRESAYLIYCQSNLIKTRSP